MQLSNIKIYCLPPLCARPNSIIRSLCGSSPRLAQNFDVSPVLHHWPSVAEPHHGEIDERICIPKLVIIPHSLPHDTQRDQLVILTSLRWYISILQHYRARPLGDTTDDSVAAFQFTEVGKATFLLSLFLVGSSAGSQIECQHTFLFSINGYFLFGVFPPTNPSLSYARRSRI